uniref:MULE transposase domain-containing protein n=1 Tax=Cajanus cajan TaxID=3821 RepID=A0A151R4C5_CAJCA|nr:hypothetical protein KK1_041460 [Cajanus cajan]
MFKPCCAFNDCELLIQIDATHLYDMYRSTLLIATTQDGNSNDFPLAFTMVEGETLNFLAHLYLHVSNRQGICLIFDRHCSIQFVIDNETLGVNSDENWILVPDPTSVRGNGHPKSTKIRNKMDLDESHNQNKNVADAYKKDIVDTLVHYNLIVQMNDVIFINKNYNIV